MLDAGVLGWVLGIGIPALYVLGALSAVDAIMKTRTPQGATAWALSLVTIPFVAIPLYWVFGRAHFSDYVHTLSDFDRRLGVALDDADGGPLGPCLARPEDEAEERERGELRALRELATLPFTSDNDGRLLVDGGATFDAIFDGIAGAREYVLAQFYIVRDDAVGQRFKQALAEYRRASFLYPDNPADYKALFMEAFILAEHFKSDSAAVHAFERMLEKHPGSELSKEADWMIRNIRSGGTLVPEPKGEGG